MKPILSIIAAFYLAMAFIGASLAAWRSEHWRFDPFAFPGDHFTAAALTSLTFCAFVILGSTTLLRHAKRMQRCAAHLRDMFGQLNNREILAIALLSGIGEEFFFRGWLLNETGLLISSLLFGLVHFPPNRDWAWWPAFAFGFGLTAGALCLWTNSLLWAILIHAAINFFNIRNALRSNPA